ncbi:hypothetical protein MMC34_005954 [Xylographa carneopallida]|nr:hypothetical protein [Xylographa carneopallida]
MLQQPTNPWFSEGIETSPRLTFAKSPPASLLPSPLRVPELVFTKVIGGITPPDTASNLPVYRPNDLPGYLRIPIPSPSRDHPAGARSIHTPQYTIEHGLPVHTSVSHDHVSGQKAKMPSSNFFPSAPFFNRQPIHYMLEGYDDKDDNDDDEPPGYPYETYTGIAEFAREYLCGMLELVMTWLEERRGMRAST